MYASVHTDRSGRVLVSNDREAAVMAGSEPTALTEAIPLPPGTDLIPLAREAIAFDRGGRARPLAKGRLALAALVPGHVRLAFPAYQDDPALPPVDPLPYAAVAADPRGELVVAAARTTAIDAAPPARHGVSPLREHPANALARQLARCSRDHSCAAAKAGIGAGELPVPLGAPAAERPRAPVALRSGYGGAPREPASFRPTAREIADVAGAHLERGGTGVSFGRACDGEPLSRIRVLEEAIALIRARAPSAQTHLETSGSDAAALRRAAGAGLTSITVRIGSALADTYERLHRPVAHRWSDVRASLQAAVEHRLTITVALLVLPGLTDRDAEIEALVALLGELPRGRLELRDLGADPLRTLAHFPAGRASGVRTLLRRIGEADHFQMRAVV
jgi:hypothetical protein